MKNYNKIIFFLLLIITIFIIGCSKKDNIGPRGSTHIHADFKVYILGNQLNFNDARFQVMDQLTHVENNDGDTLHVHATGITLGFFFKKMGMELSNECLKLENGNEYCNLDKAILKVYIKSPNTEWEQLYYHADYLINDLDKILVTYGTETDEEIKKQQESVTDKAKDL